MRSHEAFCFSMMMPKVRDALVAMTEVAGAVWAGKRHTHAKGTTGETCKARLFARFLRASSCSADLRLIVRSTAMRASFAASLSAFYSSVCDPSVNFSWRSMNTSACSGWKMARFAATMCSRSRISLLA